MTEPSSAICAWLAEQRPAMIALLEELVNIDSGSHDKAGVDEVGRRLRRFLDEHGLRTRLLPKRRQGDVLRADLNGGPGGPPILLMGHRDTVFPKGEAARRPFRIQGSRAYGPGVCDMKGGLVQNAFVMAAFQRFGVDIAPLAMLATSDEEIGSPECREDIEAAARGARAALNAEPGRPSGNVVTGRRGGVFMRLRITGKAAHSGGNYREGISAIGELGHKITALHALSNPDEGYTLNVGLVSGGMSLNTIAPDAEAVFDLRFTQESQRVAMLQRIEAIVADAQVAGTVTELSILGEFRAMEPSPASTALFESYRAAAAQVGLAVAGDYSMGCADSGFAAHVGCPTLCGTGPVGWEAHTANEYLDLDSLVPRAQALALTVIRLGRSTFPERVS